MKEIIVNHAEEKSTIVVVEDGNLVEKYEESSDLERLEGNIYLGKVTDILPGMQAAFVDIGDEKNAFLHIKDVLPKVSNKTGNKNEDLNKYNIQDYVKVGMPIVVQVKKDKTGKKGAKISTNLNIAGKFVVIIPDSSFITMSNKIEDEQETKRLISIVSKMDVKNYGVIIRTSAINASEVDIQNDVESMVSLYENIKGKADSIISDKCSCPTLLYEKGSIVKRLLTDIGNQGLDRIVVNDVNSYESIRQLVSFNGLNIEVEYIDKKDILDLYGLERQIEKITNRKVWLKCGGFITIDQTEALTAIDVNSGKYTGKESIEKTVLKVNSEATVEIAKQIRARDIGGIIIVDYIDMDTKQDEEIIYNLLIDSLKKDRAKTQVVGFTKLHLLEMTRKHICS